MKENKIEAIARSFYCSNWGINSREINSSTNIIFKNYIVPHILIYLSP